MAFFPLTLRLRLLKVIRTRQNHLHFQIQSNQTNEISHVQLKSSLIIGWRAKAGWSGSFSCRNHIKWKFLIDHVS